MLGATHAAAAAAGYLLWQSSPTGAFVAAVAATLPDLDRFIPSLHRGPTHSAAALLTLYLFGALYFPAILLPALFGYASHIFLDMLTPMGVSLFWPFSRKIRFPIAKTGGVIDAAIRLAALCAIGIVFFW